MYILAISMAHNSHDWLGAPGEPSGLDPAAPFEAHLTLSNRCGLGCQGCYIDGTSPAASTLPIWAVRLYNGLIRIAPYDEVLTIVALRVYKSGAIHSMEVEMRAVGIESAIFSVSCIFLAAGCGGGGSQGKSVGEPCESPAECASGVCLQTEGVCSVQCLADADCPGGTGCQDLGVAGKWCLPDGCQRDCAGKECGPDGCGGSCGNCTGGKVCDQGSCVCAAHAATGCHNDDVWWFDSCGGPEEVIASCQNGCADGKCIGCAPDCAGKDCGPDGCGGFCGTCTGGRVCEQGSCVCTAHASVGCHDGDVWWFDSCGNPESLVADCPYGCAEGQCLSCTPDCANKECGPDGCGDSCGTCTGGKVCQAGACVCVSRYSQACYNGDAWWFDSCGNPESQIADCQYGCAGGQCTGCTPNCAGRECGPDPVCGASCGTCTDPETCSAAGICGQWCQPGRTACSSDGYGFRACGADPDDPGNDTWGIRVPCQAGQPCLDGVCRVSQCFEPEVIILLDRSSSMLPERFAWVKAGLFQALDTFSAHAFIGFREFPGSSCGAGQVVPLAKNNASVIKNSIHDPSVEAATPIAAAFEGLSPYFGDPNDGQAVVLVTDGVETCLQSGDAIERASSLFRAGVVVHTVGVTTQADLPFLDQIAAVGGTGTSALVNDASQLFSALEAVFFGQHACCLALSVSTQVVPDAVYAEAYSAAIQYSGGYGAVSRALTSGALPPGLGFDAATGVISGTPTAVGQYTFEITVADSCPVGQQVIVRTYSIEVTADCPLLSIDTLSLPGGTYGAAYSQTIAATGGYPPVTFSLSSGSLPKGLSFNPATGTISGTPEEVGDFAFVIQAADQCPYGSQAAERAYQIGIACPCPPLSITTASLPNGTYNVYYSRTIAVSGGQGSVTFGLASGSLPGGLSLNASTGVVSGTPGALGTFPFTVRAADQCACPAGAQTAEQAYSITIGVTCPSLTITTTTLPRCDLGQAYDQTIAYSGGYGAVTLDVAAGSLPPGLSLSGSGRITGVCNQAGDFAFTARATDSCPEGARTDTQDLAIRVSCQSIQITTAWIADGVVGQAYLQPIVVQGGYGSVGMELFSGGLPAGLGLDGATFVVSGTPAENGQFAFTVRATDSCPQGAQSAQKTYRLTVFSSLWQRMYGDLASQTASDLAATADGGFILAGTSVMKFSAAGGVEWQQNYRVDDLDSTSDIQAIPAGGYFIGGSRYVSFQRVNDLHLWRVGAGGSVSWTSYYGGSYNDFLGDVDVASDGNFLAAGSSNSLDIPGAANHGGFDGYLIETSPAGAVQWQKLFGGSGDDWFLGMRATADGGSLVVGYSNSTNLPGLTNHGGLDVYVVKVDTAGGVVWQQMVGGAGEDRAWAVEIAPDGGFVVIGDSDSTDIPGAAGLGGDDIHVVKLDASGNLEWQRMVGGSGYEYGFDVKATADGGFILAGESSSTNISGVTNRGLYDAYLVKLDPTGATLWQVVFGGSVTDSARGVDQLSSGEYVFAGGSESTDIPGLTNHGGSDVYLVRFSL